VAKRDPATAQFTAYKNKVETSIAYKQRRTHTHTHPERPEAREKQRLHLVTQLLTPQHAMGAKIPIYLHKNTNCHLGFLPVSSVSGWVWVCVCLGLYAILVFPMFL